VYIYPNNINRYQGKANPTP